MNSKLMEIAKGNNNDLIDENCDIQELLYYVCQEDNVKLLKHILENYKEKVNITPKFISDWYFSNWDNYSDEMFDILFSYDVNDEAVNEIINDANEKIRDGNFALSKIEEFKKRQKKI